MDVDIVRDVEDGSGKCRWKMKMGKCEWEKNIPETWKNEKIERKNKNEWNEWRKVKWKTWKDFQTGK